jgi:hypothetical protein
MKQWIIARLTQYNTSITALYNPLIHRGHRSFIYRRERDDVHTVVEAHGQVEKRRVLTGGCQKEKRLAPQQQRAHYHGTPTITHSQPTARLTDHQNSHESAHGEQKAVYLKNNANDV